MYRLYKPNEYLDFAAGKKPLSDHFDLGTFPHEWYRRSKGIHVSGYYKIILTAEAVRRLNHPYDPAMIPTDLRPPMQLALFVSRGKKGLASDSVKSRAKIGHWDLADHQSKKFEVSVWMDVGDAPFLNWDNGPGPSDYWMRDICKKYHTDIEFRGKQGSTHGMSSERTWCPDERFRTYGKAPPSGCMNSGSTVPCPALTKAEPSKFF